MARVPEASHKGGITAFVVEADTEGHGREPQLVHGPAGIENGVTRFHDVRVPAENLIGAEGAGLKIALTTLNTGRLSLPAMCAGSGKWCLKIAREWSSERVQWGRPIGEHEAVAARSRSSPRPPSRSRPSSSCPDRWRMKTATMSASRRPSPSSPRPKMAWLVADELVQVQGERGYETAASLAAAASGVPAEQILRDLRISRIFEGSTEIMRLLIARGAVDTHLSVAGASSIRTPTCPPRPRRRGAPPPSMPAGCRRCWL